MRDRRQAMFLDARDEGFGRQGRIAARQVRHADDLDAVGFGGSFLDEGFGLLNVMVPTQHQLRGAEKLSIFQRLPQVIAGAGLSLCRHVLLLQRFVLTKLAFRSRRTNRLGSDRGNSGIALRPSVVASSGTTGRAPTCRRV